MTPTPTMAHTPKSEGWASNPHVGPNGLTPGGQPEKRPVFQTDRKIDQKIVDIDQKIVYSVLMRENLTIIRKGITALVVLMAFVIVLLSQRPVTVSQAHEGDFPLTGPSNTPTWTHKLANQFPNCHSMSSKPKNVIPSSVVSYPLDGGHVVTMSLDQAFKKNNRGQFFVVGYCQ